VGDQAPSPSRWEHILGQTTTTQRLIVAISSIATAVVAVGTIVIFVVRWLDDDDDRGDDAAQDATEFAAANETATVRSGTAGAAALVTYLLSVSGGDPVMLDIQIPEREGDGHLPLYYECDDSGTIGQGTCSFVRLEQGFDIPQRINPEGWWLRGCYLVAQDGAGYRAEHLDLELRRVNDQCATG
jgi:hypothetical protein